MPIITAYTIKKELGVYLRVPGSYKKLILVDLDITLLVAPQSNLMFTSCLGAWFIQHSPSDRYHPTHGLTATVTKDEIKSDPEVEI